MSKVIQINFRQSAPVQIHGLLILIVFFAFIILLLIFLTLFYRQRSDIQTLHVKAKSEQDDCYFRLPDVIRPVLYTLHLRVNLPYVKTLNFGDKNFTIDGMVNIDFECLKDVDRIKLNAKQLSINASNVSVIDRQNVSLSITLINLYHYELNDIGVIEIVLNSMLIAGHNYSLKITYSGLINSVWIGGLFKSDYDLDNQTRLLALTQLQPTDASRLMPCFDEPQLKSAFQISITHPVGTSAISNSQIRRFRQLNVDWSKTEFEETPVMSTYLLAVAVTDFKFKFRYCRNIEIRIWCQPAKLYDIDYALGVICRLLTYYENFFSIKYPLKKLDVFAAPELRVLAMENWGLIAVRQKLLVFNDQMNSLRERRVVTDVLAHEIAHMWFGNLATMRWWNDLWLNEGFATMMGQKAADYVENTKLRMTQYFAADITLKALSTDQHSVNTQPISLKQNSNQPHGQNNKILYNKGAAVLRMVESTIGDRVFRNGLGLYLNKFAYSNADKEDFLNSFSSIFEMTARRNDPFLATNFSVSEFIDSWIYQKGFPLIKIRSSSDHFEITQQIFDVDQNVECEDTQWIIPLFIEKNSGTEIVWLQQWQTVRIEHKEAQPFVIDPKFYGYYRVDYGIEHWRLLVRELLNDHQHFTASTKLRLLDDAFVLAENGFLPYEVPLQMSTYLRNETDVVPFITFLARFETILYRAYRHPKAPLINQYILYLLQPGFDKLVQGSFIVSSDKVLEFEILRELVYLKMCTGGYKPCVDMFLDKFKQLYNNCSNNLLSSTCNKIEPSLRNVVYMVACKFGKQDELSFINQKYRVEQYHVERDRLFSALSSSTNSTQIDLFLFI